MRAAVWLLMIALVVPVPAPVWAAHPLITDDTGTQGKGKFQLEVNGQYDTDRETVNGVSVKSTGGQSASTVSYGIADTLDLIANVPYQWSRITENGVPVYNERGLSDISCEAKWRFFEKNGLSFGLKPGIRFPTGSEERGLGTGRAGGSLFLIGSMESGPWAFHANVGYIRNGNEAGEDKNLWHASLAATCEVVKSLKLAANIGSEKNPVKPADNDPSFLIVGGIYTLTENFDIDAGVKRALTSSETDLSVLAGIAYRF